MGKKWICALAGVLLLTACGAPAETVPPESPAPVEEEEGEVPVLPDLDLSALEAEMPPEDYAVLESYLPILTGEASFRWAAGPFRGYEGDWESQDVTLTEFHDALWADNGPGTDALELDSLAVADVVQSGSRDLVLLVRDLGYNYLILHREEDGAVYGTDLYIRWFMDLQENGMYVGSGGADDHTYHHMSFQDGRFVGQELAHAVGGAYEVNGQTVTEEEFDTWEFETMVGGVAWYAQGS